MDTSFKTFLRETGKKNYVRTGLFRRKRTKTFERASKKEKQEYERWKSRKIKQQEERTAALFDTQTASTVLQSTELAIKNTKSQQELDNIKFLETIQQIDAVDLSADLKSYIEENDFEEKYPGIIDNVFESIRGLPNSFRDAEEYAQVVVTNNINNKSEILEHCNWMIIPPSSPSDVELRNVDDMGSWVLQTTADVGLFSEGTQDFKTDLPTVKPTEKPKPRPQKLQIRKPPKRQGFMGRLRGGPPNEPPRTLIGRAIDGGRNLLRQTTSLFGITRYD